jgi:hypothetical protein
LSRRTLQYTAIGLVAGAVLAGAVLTTRALTASPALDANGLPTGPVSYAFIQARPEASLMYPGSKMFSQFGGGESVEAFVGRQNADIGAVMTTSASQDQIYAWYRTQLGSRGWTFLGPSAVLSTETSSQGYNRGTREVFLVGIIDPTGLRDTLGRGLPPGVIGYEYSYAIEPSPTESP